MALRRSLTNIDGLDDEKFRKRRRRYDAGRVKDEGDGDRHELGQDGVDRVGDEPRHQQTRASPRDDRIQLQQCQYTDVHAISESIAELDAVHRDRQVLDGVQPEHELERFPMQRAVSLTKNKNDVPVPVIEPKRPKNYKEIEGELVAIMIQPTELFGRNIKVLRASVLLSLRSLEAMSYKVVKVSEELWQSMPEYERIPYLKTEIGLK
ncbi:unnamed protein product [Trichogramma brassicae]|uniref:Uncharacterized protein n=1 Tax=Trichogramma brassicae TaxID=86971 RepID=A0A6H5J388_9HYME|nr:unnamed protein product [Trichogramma brassicae]